MYSSTLNLASGAYLHGQTQPQRTALVVGEQEYSYGAFAAAAGRVATWLRSCMDQGNGEADDDPPARRDADVTAPPAPARRGPRVGILAARSLETYAGIVGAAWAGGTYVPLNPKQPASRLSFVIERARLDALVVDARGAQRLFDLGPMRPADLLLPDDVCVDLPTANVRHWSELSTPGPVLPPTPVAPDHPAYIIFTSGTTGVPKGVIVAASNIAHTLGCVQAIHHLTPADRVAQFFETTFDVSVMEMFACWQAGAALHVVPETKQMAPGGFIRQREITVWHSVPSLILMMHKLRQLEPGSMPSLRVSVFGGEGVPVASLQAWQEAAPNSVVDNQYGPTEVAVGCIWHRLTDPPIETPGRGTLAIGKPFPGMHAAILGPDREFMADGEIGELAMCGPQVAPGYLGDAEQTARRFRMLNHPQLGWTRWYLTGDSAYLDERGHLHCLGRIDNQVKVMGHRVELEEIEAHLRAVCHTEEVAAVAWPVVNGNPAGIVAFISRGRNGHLEQVDVREVLKTRVPSYMIPTRVVALETLPLSTNGKVDRQGLRNMLEEKVLT